MDKTDDMYIGLTSRIENLPIESPYVLAGLLAAVGLLYCFLGYRLFKFILGLTGFLLAGFVAAALAGWLTHGQVLAMSIAGVLGGFCGALALFFLYRLGVFCLGGLGGFVIAYQVLSGRAEPWAPWAILGIGLGVGVLALLLERPVMSLATATIGAWLTVYAVLLVLAEQGWLSNWEPEKAGATSLSPLTWGMLGGWGLLSLLGAGLQLRNTKRRDKE